MISAQRTHYQNWGGMSAMDTAVTFTTMTTTTITRILFPPEEVRGIEMSKPKTTTIDVKVWRVYKGRASARANHRETVSVARKLARAVQEITNLPVSVIDPDDLATATATRIDPDEVSVPVGEIFYTIRLDKGKKTYYYELSADADELIRSSGRPARVPDVLMEGLDEGDD